MLPSSMKILFCARYKLGMILVFCRRWGKTINLGCPHQS